MTFTFSHLLTRDAKGWTCRDVPMMMRRSHWGKSCTHREHVSGTAEWAILSSRNETACWPFSLSWRIELADSHQRTRYLMIKCRWFTCWLLKRTRRKFHNLVLNVYGLIHGYLRKTVSDQILVLFLALVYISSSLEMNPALKQLDHSCCASPSFP